MPIRALFRCARTESGGIASCSFWLMGFCWIPLMGVLCSCNLDPAPLLRVATHVWPGYELLYLAREQGYYDDRQIRLVEG